MGDTIQSWGNLQIPHRQPLPRHPLNEFNLRLVTEKDALGWDNSLVDEEFPRKKRRGQLEDGSHFRIASVDFFQRGKRHIGGHT